MTDLRAHAARAVDHSRESLVQRGRDARDRLVASDPGLGRLRHGLRAVVAVGTTVVLQSIVATAAGIGGQALRLHVMIGAVVALNLATTLREPRRRVVLGTAAWSGVGAAIGAAAAVLAAPWRPVVFVVFVAVTFATVWMRRFGPRWFTAGFVMWQAHFFGLFLHPPIGALPGMIAASFLSTAWVAVLLTTVLAADPEATLRRTVTALRAQARATISACLDVIDRPASPAVRRRLRAEQVRTSEVALLFDGQLADARALPEGVSPVALRQWIVDLEIGVDETAGAVVDLADRLVGAHPPPAQEVVPAVRAALVELGWSRYAEARIALARLRQQPHWTVRPVRRFVIGADLLLTTVAAWTSGAVLTQARVGDEPTDSDRGHSPDAISGTGAGAGTGTNTGAEGPTRGERAAYEPVVELQGGALPGSQALAGEATALDAQQRWSAARVRFTTRQAIQAATAAAIALVVGDLVSPQRAYWAAIAAFVTFTGASTTTETARKAIDRTIGTLIGLLASLALAQVSSGRPVVSGLVMAAGIFLAFYVQALSTTWMICFITVVIGQLYELLRTFSEDVLLLRLAETAVGAAAGILVTYAVLPLRARDTLVVARRTLLTALADLLVDAGGLVGDGRPPAPADRARLYREVVAMDEAARQLAAGHDSLIRPRIFDADHAARRHRVAVLGVCASSARALVQALVTPDRADVGVPDPEAPAAGEPPSPAPPAIPPAVADVCRVLSAEARRLAEVPDLKDQRPARADIPGVSVQVTDLLEGAGGIPILVARRAQRLADALALLTPRRR